MKHIGCIALLMALIGHAAWAQPEVRIDLRTEPLRAATVQALAERSQARKAEAVAMARTRGWAVRGVTPEGRVFELMELNELGQPMYYITMNVQAAISTAADLVRNTAPYNLSGTNLIVGVWDGGWILTNHQEFVSPQRVFTKGSAASWSSHGTHVGGTIGAKGHVSAALGMAPSVIIHSYDWNSDLSEMTAASAKAANLDTNVYVSNHSYGYLSGWENMNYDGYDGWHWFGWYLSDREDRGFGQYSTHARDWDSLCYSALYYLPFKAAGNDRNDGTPSSGGTFRFDGNNYEYNPSTHPFADGHKDGYNTISYIGVAKNVMTVGAVTDAISGGQRDPSAADMSAFSGWGPADDGRIKPDIVANGVGVYSPTAGSTSSYATYQGTSMSTPNAAGSALLLIEHYRNLFPGKDMRAATLKGLIIHTADDMGRPGPDYRYGWGLMNTKAAADHITAHYEETNAHFMVEATLSNNGTNTYEFYWDGENAIRATLSWTDPAGTAQSSLNSATIVLVNDLDLRIICPNGTTNFPYILDPANWTNDATFGDNIRDNVEQVYMAEPDTGGLYTVRVTHKGSLSDGSQDYSLLLSGTTEEEGEVTPNYGMRDDGGVNLPTLTYWHDGLGSDTTEQGLDFNAREFGERTAFYIKGAAIKTWKSGEGDVTGTRFEYKLWKQGDAEPASNTVREVGWTSDDGSGDQTWADFGDEIDVVTGLEAGDYNLRIVFSVQGTGTPGILSNGPFTATFQIAEEGPMPPDAPIVLPASDVGTTNFTARWEASDGATNYLVDLAANPDFSGGNLDNSVGNVTSADVTGAEPDETYYYRVRAQGEGGISGHSATQSVTTLPDEPEEPEQFVWDTISSPQTVDAPFLTTLTAADGEGLAVPDYEGTADLSAHVASTNAVGEGLYLWPFPFFAYWEDARSQVIYVQSELESEMKLNGLALHIHSIPEPPLELSNWTIRVKHTALSEYVEPELEGPDSGWTIVFSEHTTISTTGWVWFAFSELFDYNGVSNLMIDYSFNNTSYTTNAFVFAEQSMARTVYTASDSEHGDPLDWSGTNNPTTYIGDYYPNIRLITERGVMISPTETAAFTNGVWSGMIAVEEEVENVFLRATSGAVAGDSNVFDVEEEEPEPEYTLTVLSAYGTPWPSGVTTNSAGTNITAVMHDSPVLGGEGVQYVCAGAHVVGNDFTEVNPTNITLVLTNDTTITWQWFTNYWLNPVAGSNGVVNVEAGWQPDGVSTTITATADQHYHFTHWTGDVPEGDVEENPLTLLMDGPRTVYTHFAATVTSNSPVAVPHAWLDEYFGDADYEAVAMQLSSNGVMTVWETYVAGLHPTDPDSVLAAEAVEEDDTGYHVIRWMGTDQPSRRYHVHGTTNLFTPMIVLESDILSQHPAMNVYTDTLFGLEGSAAYYRVRVTLDSMD